MYYKEMNEYTYRKYKWSTSFIQVPVNLKVSVWHYQRQGPSWRKSSQIWMHQSEISVENRDSAVPFDENDERFDSDDEHVYPSFKDKYLPHGNRTRNGLFKVVLYKK